LLAVTGALAAIVLYRSGRRGWAACALLSALLSKETVLFTPIVAIALDRRPGERWGKNVRRAWPLAAAVLVWGALWFATIPRRPSLGLDVKPSPSGFLAAFAHLVQVIPGLEWPHDPSRLLHAPPWLTIALAGTALWIAGTSRPGERARSGGAPDSERT